MFKRLSRDIIMVCNGTHRGEFLVEVDREKDMHIFLGLPDKVIHRVKQKDVERGLKEKVLQVVEKLPKAVYNVCLEEYKLILSEQRIHNNN